MWIRRVLLLGNGIGCRRLAGLFMIYATIAVSTIAVLVPPFENSDEATHFRRADQIAMGGLVATHYGGTTTAGGVVDRGIGAMDDIISGVRFHADRKVSSAMLAQADGIGWTGKGSGSRRFGLDKETFANTSIYPPVL